MSVNTNAFLENVCLKLCLSVCLCLYACVNMGTYGIWKRAWDPVGLKLFMGSFEPLDVWILRTLIRTVCT